MRIECYCTKKMERNQVILETPNGKLRGTFEQSCLGDDYYAFKGIPYAKPPIDQLRFQPPQPAEPWTEIRDATTHGPISAQYDHEKKKVVGSEDCLYLNVYSRSLELDAKAPVMFWIHGGGFYYGSGNDDIFGPDYLLAKNVVLVTINYRLGVFGYLKLGHKDALGNQGLKDQVMALKWVRDNIANFGGDSNNVTIFGGSSGAASVHYLTISPAARGLFHKAICQSGTVFGPINTAREPNQADLYDFVENLGCQDKDPEIMVKFLKTTSFEKLIEMQEKNITLLTFFKAKALFSPTVDDRSEEPFMPTSSIEAAKQGIQVPLMVGWNGMEGLSTLPTVQALDLKDADLNLEKYTSPTHEKLLQLHGLTLEELRYLYFKNEPISEKTLINLLNFLIDIALVYYIQYTVKTQVHSGSAPTYLYKLSFDKNLSLSKMQMKTTIKGPNHGDELMYLFRANVCDTLNFEQLQEGTGGDRVMRQMVELWTNFASTGRPTLEKSDLLPIYWQPVVSDVVLRYLNIDEELHMEKGRPTLEKSDLLPVYWLPVASDVVLRYLNIDEELRMEKALNIEQRYSGRGENAAQFH